MVRIILALLGLFALLPMAHAELVVLPRSIYADFDPPRAEYEIPLSLVNFSNTSWTREEIYSQVRQVAQVYAQCNLRLSTVSVYNLSQQIPAKVDGWNPDSENSCEFVAKQTQDIPRPAYYLIEDSSPRTTSFAKGEFKEKPKGFYPDSLLNTVWLVHEVNSPDHTTRPYSTAAHELGHVLLQDGMENGDRPGNLMTSMSARNNFLPAAMCAEMMQSPLVRKVIARGEAR